MKDLQQGNGQNRNADAVLRELFYRYGPQTYQMLLEKCGDERRARELLKMVFQAVYREIQDAGDTDIAAIWIRSISSATLRRQAIKAAQQPQITAPVQQNGVPASQGISAASHSQTGARQAAQPWQHETPLYPKGAFVQPTAGFVRPAAVAFEPYIPQGKKEGKERNAGRIALIIGLSILILITIWMLAGLLMDITVLPEIDLGYTWFNTYIFDLF